MNPDDMLLFKEAVEWINLTAALREEGPPPNQRYWDTLIEGVLGSRFTAPAAWKIYRARVMPLERELDAEPLAAEDMVPPPPALAPAGRLNPPGVSYFYGALEPETAMAEAQPWRRARISVARFSSTTELALADLTGDFTTSERGSELKWLSFMLARPVHRDDAEAYLASQRVAQECRAAGLSGVLFDSSLKPGGVNVALFAHDRLECQEVELHEVTGVSYTAQRLWPQDWRRHVHEALSAAIKRHLADYATRRLGVREGHAGSILSGFPTAILPAVPQDSPAWKPT